MARQRTRWNKATKFKVTMEAYKAERSVTEVAQEYGVHPSQAHRWKKELMEQEQEIFAEPPRVSRRRIYLSSRSGWCTLLNIIRLFKLHRRNVADRFEQSPVVEPIDPFEGGVFHRLD